MNMPKKETFTHEGDTTYTVFSFDQEEEKLKKIHSEYTEWFEVVQKKRKSKSEDLKLYVEESKDKIRNHTLYQFVQTYLSVFYTGDIPVRWSGSNGKIREVADNLNETAEFDYREMGLFEKDYNWQWHSIMFGVGVQIYKGFDEVTKTPIIETINPLSVIPDPFFTEFNISGHRYFWIEMEASIEEMKSCGSHLQK